VRREVAQASGTLSAIWTSYIHILSVEFISDWSKPPITDLTQRQPWLRNADEGVGGVAIHHILQTERHLLQATNKADPHV
jgi:hypothetical protein